MVIRFVLAGLFITLFVLIVLNCGNSELRAQSLQNQAICAAEARKTFQQDNAEWDRQDKQMNLGMETISVDYESHYNTKARCNERIADFEEMLGNIDYSERGEISCNNVCTLSRPVP